MKSIIKFTYPVLFAVAILLTGCDIKNPIDGIDVKLNQKEIVSTVSLSFVDAATGLQITSAEPGIKIEFSGEDAANLITLKETELTTVYASQGILSFAVKNDRLPSKQNPVQFNIMATFNGYASVSKSIAVNKVGANIFEIVMVNLSAPPDGSVITENQPVPSDNGQVNSEVSVSTTGESLTGCTSSLTIESGTSLTDENGAAVTGNLTASVAYFNNKTPESLNAFPGGLIAKAKTQGGAVTNGYFTTAGFAEFTIKNQSGQEVKNFGNNAVEFSIDVPAGTINKNTGSPIKDGDVVPVWSFDESAATWNYETMGTAYGPDANGNYKVTYEGTHLSWWNIGWLGESVCTDGATINVNGSFASLKLVISDLNGNFIASETVTSDTTSTGVVYIKNAPSGVPVKIEAFDNIRCSGNKVGEVIVNDLCGQEVNLGVQTQGTTVNVNVNAYCPNSDPVFKIRPSIDIYLENECGERICVGKMIEGKLTLKSLEIGKSYVFGVYYDDDDDPTSDNWHPSDPQNVDKTDFDFNYELGPTVCDDL